MHGLYNELIPPNGVEFATFLNLKPLEKSSSSTSSARILGHLVIARSSSLRIFEVREEPAPLPTLQQVENDTKDEWMRRGTEAVEGEVEMDERGEGFVNMATVKVCKPVHNLRFTDCCQVEPSTGYSCDSLYCHQTLPYQRTPTPGSCHRLGGCSDHLNSRRWYGQAVNILQGCQNIVNGMVPLSP